MKKIIMFLLLSSLTFAYGFAGGKAFASGGKFVIKDSPTTTINTLDDTGFYLEIYPKLQEHVEAGLGLKFNGYSEEATDKGVASVTTLYGVARFFLTGGSFLPYIQFKAGYPYALDGDYVKDYKNPSGTNSNDLAGQAYLGMGVGGQLFFLDISLNYEWNSFSLTSNSWVGAKNVTQSNIGINLGFKY